MRTLIVHGRQPILGRAELESLFGAEIIRPVGDNATLLEKDPAEIDFSRLGGMVKFCKVLSTLETTDWDEIHKFLEEVIPKHLIHLLEGKLRLGLSVYGLNVTPKRLHATGLTLKKIIRSTGRSVRYVPNVKSSLNSAQVLYNQLTQKLGWELVFVRDGNKTVVAQSIAVQDIEKYAARDQVRPCRDARVGMLPPKLAQIIINLSNPPANATVLDPFCGTGVLLQEALLMGFNAHGSDIEPRMVEYSEKNLEWLENSFQTKGKVIGLEVADAISHRWVEEFSAIACETYLGKPLSTLLEQNKLKPIIDECDDIHTKFLANLASQTKPGFRMCLAVPAWKTKKGFLNLPTLEKLDELGYNRVSFVHASKEDLIYHRPGQIVARELVVVERK